MAIEGSLEAFLPCDTYQQRKVMAFLKRALMKMTFMAISRHAGFINVLIADIETKREQICFADSSEKLNTINKTFSIFT